MKLCEACFMVGKKIDDPCPRAATTARIYHHFAKGNKYVYVNSQVVRLCAEHASDFDAEPPRLEREWRKHRHEGLSMDGLYVWSAEFDRWLRASPDNESRIIVEPQIEMTFSEHY